LYKRFGQPARFADDDKIRPALVPEPMQKAPDPPVVDAIDYRQRLDG
jgi:hypothetical protein